MATQTRAQGSNKKKTTRRRSRKQQATGLSLWVIRGREFLQGLFPDIAISDRLKREVLGVALVLLALLSSWSPRPGGRAQYRSGRPSRTA